MASRAANAVGFPNSRSDVPDNLTRSGRTVKVKNYFDENGVRTLDTRIVYSLLAVLCAKAHPVKSGCDSEADLTHVYDSAIHTT
jgi:hypothetical protein